MVKEDAYLPGAYSELNNRLSELMQTNHFTIHGLSKKSGIAVGTIQRMLTDPSCNPTIASIDAICGALNVSIGSLFGKAEDTHSSAVPIVKWEDISEHAKDIKKNLEYIESLGEVQTPSVVSPYAFGLKMRDNAMLPLFPEHSTLIFDVERKPEHNHYVLIKMHNHDQVMFKQLWIDNPFKYAISINPLFKESMIKLDKNDKIIAVLVQAQIQY